MMKLATMATAVIILLGLSACASTGGPILYPNEHLLSAGREGAERDIAACREMAAAAGASEGAGRTGDIATNTAIGAGMGAVSGAAGGAMYGSAGRGFIAGAIGGATAGLMRGLMYSGRPAQPDPAYTSFVARCLQEKGYEVTGWQ